MCYGYRIVKTLSSGHVTTGEREIEPAEAAIVARIFRDFIAGISPKQLAKNLNREGVAGPFGGPWSPSTIYGNAKRGTGILNNELYIGRLVWNRLRYVKNPDTGKRVSRMNPPSEWMTREVPALRIVTDEVWTAAKARQGIDSPRGEIIRPPGKGAASAVPFLRADEVRSLRRGIHHGRAQPARLLRSTRSRPMRQPVDDSRDEVEARVLSALQEKLLRQDLFEEFCEEFTREMNRLRMEHRATLTAAEREIERIEVRRKKLVQSIMDGVPASEVRDELTGNAARREELKASLAAADAPPPLLHPEMAELYRLEVTTLAQALEQPETRVEATEALRGLIDAIMLTPSDGELRIELKGNLAAMLSAATNAKRSPETGDLSLQVEMVAGRDLNPS